MDQSKLLQALIDQLSRHSIGHLTINNYGSLTILGEAAQTPAAPMPVSTQYASGGEIEPMWGWQTAHIKIKNSLGGPIYRFKLSHQRGLNSPVYQDNEWYNIGSGSTTGTWATDYQAGFNSDFDLWYCEVQPENNGPTFKHWSRAESQYLQCNLRDNDKWQDGDLTFEITGDRLKMNLRSGGDDLEFSKCSVDNFNHFAFIEVENKFGVPISEISVKHSFDDKSYTHTWPETVSSGGKSSPWPVYYKTGNFIGDKWNISVKRQGDKNAHVNDKKDKGCWLQDGDKGRACQLIVKDGGWTMNFPSGNCNDDWDWKPNTTNMSAQRVVVRRSVEKVEDEESDWTREL